MTQRSLTTVLALSVAAVAFSTGGAVAGSLVTGAQIKDGTVTTKDVKNGTLGAADLRKSTVRAFSEPGPRGAPGLVRAYGRVAADGTVTRAAPGVSVTRAETGVYCITAPGVTRARTVAVVSPDFEYGATGVGQNPAQSFVEFGGGDYACPAAAISVRTFVRFLATNGDQVLVTSNMVVTDQPFTFLVP
jgi:hypothetical protein